MSTRTRSRKRHRSPDNTDNSNSNNKNIKEPPKKKQRSCNNNTLQLVDLSEYFCCVCKELPSNKIFQCPNGCVICEQCYPKIIPCKCPLCRCIMNKNKPIRCRIAERTLALRPVRCRFDGCNTEILFSNLHQHEMNECEFKPIECKFSVLGCKWKGLRQYQQEHESQCKCDQNESLKIVKEINRKLLMYQQFCKDCSNIHCDSIWVSSEEEFEESTQEFYFEGYEYEIQIKSEKTRIRRNQEIYKIYIKLIFAEDIGQLDNNETIQVDIGIIIEPHGNISSNFMKRLKYTISRENVESEWLLFEHQQQISKDQYINMFRGGFDVKIFCFGEDL